VALLVLVLGGCAQARQPALEPAVDHVVLIVVDTLRADAVGCYGGEDDTANMDRLAAEGMRFANARSHIPITGPSLASLFTSLWPSEHGVHNNAQVLDGSVTTLAEVLHADGFTTAAFVSLGVLKAKFGMARGFDTYVDRFGLNWYRDAADLNREVIEFVRRAPPKRGFLFVHYSDPHEPYAPPDRTYPVVQVMQNGIQIAELTADGSRQEIRAAVKNGRASLRLEAGIPAPVEGEPVTLVGGTVSVAGRMWPGWGLHRWFEDQQRHDFVTALPAHLEISVHDPATESVVVCFGVGLKLSPEQARSAYLGEVAFVDRAIGELLTELERSGWLERSLVVLSADHGEGLGDHGLQGHIHQLYDSLLRVPLILWAPGVVPAGEVVHQPVGLVDVFPTVTRLTASMEPQRVRGRDLLARPVGGLEGGPPLLAQTFAPEADEDLEAIVVGGHKLIRPTGGGRMELYSLVHDRYELQNLSSSRLEQGQSLATRLDTMLAEAEVGEPSEAVLDDEERRQLEALGYTR